jgi:integrase
MATIRKRGAYQWEVRIRRYGYAQVHKTFTSKADADAWAREIETEMDRGVHLSRHEAERTTLRECFERYLQEITPAKKGAKQEENRIRQLMKQEFANRSMASLRGVDLSGYRDKRILSGLSPYSVNNELIILSHVFTIARTEWGMVSLQNPVSDIRRPKLPKGRSRRLSVKEEHKLLNDAQTELRAIIIIALETAMREGEIAGLTRSNVDYSIPAIELSDTKNGESRTVPLSTKAVTVLRSLPARIDI